MNGMGSQFEEWVVPILDAGGTIRGTGWLITPAAVVTCSHVLDDASYDPSDLTTIDVPGLTVTSVEQYPERDLVVVRVQPPDDDGPAEVAGLLPPLTRLSARGDEIYSHGFDSAYSIEAFPEGAPMTIGRLTGPAVSLADGERTQPMYVIDGVVVHGGQSGAPAWNQNQQAIMGIIAKSDYSNRAFVIPIEDLLDQWPEFEREDPGRISPKVGSGPIPPDEAVAPFGLPPRRPTIGAHTDIRLAGRDGQLDELNWRIAQGQDVTVASAVKTHAVYGLGGIGKTALALEFCHKNKDRFSLVWWVNAESLATISTAYRELAVRLRLPFQSDEDARAQVNTHLHQRQNWLAVFDNVDSQELLATERPESDTGQVLATSRNPHNWQHPLHLEPIEREPSINWLLVAANHPQSPSELAAAQRLSENLGGLALALAMATSYIRSTGCSLAEYEEHFEQELALSEDFEDVPSDYGKSVYTAWNISIEELEHTTPEAKVLLDYLSFCAPDRIPIRIFTPESLHPDDEATAKPGDINRAIRGLLRYSLATREGGYLYVHRLVQQVTRHQLQTTPS